MAGRAEILLSDMVVLVIMLARMPIRLIVAD